MQHTRNIKSEPNEPMDEWHLHKGPIMADTGNGADGAWEKHVDESSGTPYYYNTVTGESSWDVPVTYVEKQEADEKQRKATPKWRKYEDEASGTEYYVDSANDVTQWERPEDFTENEDADENGDEESGWDSVAWLWLQGLWY